MTLDTIIEEIHQTRGKLLADCEDDLDQLLNRYESSEKQDQGRLVSFSDVRKKREKKVLVASRDVDPSRP